MQNDYSKPTTNALPKPIAGLMHRVLIAVAVAVGILLPGGSLFAREQNEKVEKFIEELFLGEIVYPQGKGEFQITTGYLLGNKGNDFLWGSKGDDDFEIPLYFEYGLTDYSQMILVCPINFHRTGVAETEGVGNIELEYYYNFYNDPQSGRAYGVGFSLGLPPATSGVGSDSLFYEPFFVAYQQLDSFAINFSAILEVEDPLSDEDETEVGADFDLAFLRKYDQFVLLTELNTAIESDDTLVRFAPGVCWRPKDNFELGVSLPIGLTTDTPDLGVFVLMTIEFGGADDE